TVTKSCPFFLASGIVLLLSFIVFLIPTCSHQNNLYYFSAGIMFIVSGLLMLIGLIAYISILKAEIGSKLRPRSSLQPPMFKVTYGQSFFLFVFGFIATEFVGLLNIFLYISLQEAGYYSVSISVCVCRLPCFSISNLQEKIREGENRQKRKQKNAKNTYKSYKHELDKKPIDRKRHGQQNKKRQVRAQELELDSKKLLKNMTQMGRIEAVAAAAASGRRSAAEMFDKKSEAPLACRKHPNGLGSTMFLNELERRYYFEKNSDHAMSNKCNLHSKNLAKSLNELYLESTLPPPPPSAIRMGGGGGGGLQHQRQRQQQQAHRSQYQLQIQTLPRPPQQFSDTPQEFPLTRSVSTTTEIYATHNVSFAGDLSEKATNAQHSGSGNNKASLHEQKNSTSLSNRRRNVATNTRYNSASDTETQANVALGTERSGGSNNKNKNLYNKRLEQLQHQQHHYDGKTNYKFDEQQHQRGHRPVHHNNGNVDVEDDAAIDHNHHANENEEDDDNDGDEEQPQKLCGLKRGIRKTKDELFEEFCKRAGVRPKPKNIYYIENDDDDDDAAENDVEEEQQLNHRRDMNAVMGTGGGMNHKMFRSKHNLRTTTNTITNQQNPLDGRKKLHDKLQSEYRTGANDSKNASGKTRENNHIFLSGEDTGRDEVGDNDVDDNDDDDDGDHGFKKLTENEDHLYVIDDNIHLMPPSAALRNNNRRASMYVEPNHLRRLSSNLSLHALYTPLPVPKPLYDFESPVGVNSDYAANAFPLTHGNTAAHHHHYMTRDVYGGSQNRLHHPVHPDYQQQMMYQSRTTLPRALVKRNTDSQDSIASALSTSQLHNIYSSSQQRLTNLMVQHQQQQQLQQQQQQQHQLQQLQPQNRYLSLSREQDVYSSRYGLHKSNEELNGHFVQQQQHQQQTMYLQPPPHQIQYTQHPLQQQQQHSHMSSSLKQQQQPMVQWPTAIPSSPSNFRLYSVGGPTASVVSSQNSNHAVLTRSQSGGGNGTAGGHGPSKFQRAYAFDEQRRPSGMVGDAFDLDEIERERRRSHASLYAGMAIVNGSPTVKTNNTSSYHYDMINGTAV
ncbi:uncharacterized protein LOC133335000, partial [Musca vetustissima]|uniref:uncharacterized protein LOC133335000 n=1 Tax=Musca vetustissima TaxID=27455 RepID=UPI002AB64320